MTRRHASEIEEARRAGAKAVRDRIHEVIECWKAAPRSPSDAVNRVNQIWLDAVTALLFMLDNDSPKLPQTGERVK